MSPIDDDDHDNEDRGGGSTTETDVTEPMDRHVGGRIWKRRRELGLSRRELGERVGVGLKQVNKYETGANRVSAGRLFDIAQVLSVAPSWFFEEFAEAGGAGYDDPPEGDETFGDTADIRNLLAVYHRIPQDIRSRLLRLVRAIADADES